ncbi:MAG TPA: sigma-70 family RNA polymerase sigma factor [Lacipirellulaceae bacterium]
MDDDLHLSQIQTLWSVVRQAHGDQTVGIESAQRVLLDRYGGAIHRYALAALREEDAADEVFQEFALKFVRGEFGKVDPERGRFRAFVKTVVYRLIVDYQRRKKKRVLESPMHSNIAEPLAGGDEGADDELFRVSWRTDLLDRSWKILEQAEKDSGKPYHTVLRYRVDHPDARSPELAEGLSKQLGKPINAGAVRVLIHRAREEYGDILLKEITDSLPDDSLDEAEQELIELGLLDYCRPALDRRRESSK